MGELTPLVFRVIIEIYVIIPAILLVLWWGRQTVLSFALAGGELKDIVTLPAGLSSYGPCTQCSSPSSGEEETMEV
jgi:hypothetical protein